MLRRISERDVEGFFWSGLKDISFMQEVAKAEQKVYILEVSIKKSRMESKIAKCQLRFRSWVRFMLLIKFKVD